MDNAESIQQLLDSMQNIDADSAAAAADAAQNMAASSFYSSMFGFGMFSALMSMWWSWVIGIITIASLWFIFVKANKPGWAAIIPIYNVLVMLEILGKPWWWLILLLIPFVNILVGIVMCYYLAKAFRQDIPFTVGLVLLPFIFMPLLAWGKYSYKKPAGA